MESYLSGKAVSGASTWDTVIVELTQETSPSNGRSREHKLVSPSVDAVFINMVHSLRSLDGEFLGFRLGQKVWNTSGIVAGRGNLQAHPDNRLDAGLAEEVYLNVFARVGRGIARDETEVTTDIAIDSSGIAENNNVRLAIVGDNGDGAISGVNAPGKVGRVHFVQNGLVPGQDGLEHLEYTSGQRVLRVISHQAVVTTRKEVPPVAVVLRLEEFITTSVDDQLRHSEVLLVVEGINDISQYVQFRGAKVLRDLHLNVVSESEGPATKGLEHSLHNFFHVQQVKDERDNTNNTLVSSTRKPSGGTALRSTSNNEFGDTDIRLEGEHELSHSVHGTDGGLHHWEVNYPLSFGSRISLQENRAGKRISKPVR